MANKISKRQQRIILKKMGIDIKSLPKKDVSTRIEEGREKHRRYLQEMKNQEIQNSPDKEQNKPEVFFYRGQESPEYTNLQSLFLSGNWEDENEE